MIHKQPANILKNLTPNFVGWGTNPSINETNPVEGSTTIAGAGDYGLVWFDLFEHGVIQLPVLVFASVGIRRDTGGQITAFIEASSTNSQPYVSGVSIGATTNIQEQKKDAPSAIWINSRYMQLRFNGSAASKGYTKIYKLAAFPFPI